MTSSVIITIVVVLGIIVAGGFLFYFLGDLFMGLANKNKDTQAIKEKQLKDQKELEARVEALENSQVAKNDPEIAAILYDGAIVEAYDPNEEEVTEAEETAEDVAEEVSAEEVVEETTEEVAEEEAEEVAEEAETENEEEDDTAEFIRQRRAELMERLARMQEEQNAEEDGDEEAVDLSEENEETEEQTEVEETEEMAEETAEVPVEEKVAIVEKETIVEVKVPVAGPLSNLTLEELEARLADEQESLKENEKDLRQCKKEFIPLRRVKKTLENDEKKLRRKEALVAKQKVVLYGVNNYGDIDEEKAKKLAEDLDLLDGLKLSVQHCQEVMDKNEERYPLLEKIFNLLTSQNEEIKNDIKDLEEAIATLKNQDSDADAE